jgi:hypothetical protein
VYSTDRPGSNSREGVRQKKKLVQVADKEKDKEKDKLSSDAADMLLNLAADSVMNLDESVQSSSSSFIGAAGPVSRDDWRKWVDEKQRMIRSHNKEKTDMLLEMKRLRKLLDPRNRDVLSDNQNMYRANVQLEEHSINANIRLDTLTVRISCSQAFLSFVPYICSNIFRNNYLQRTASCQLLQPAMSYHRTFGNSNLQHYLCVLYKGSVCQRQNTKLPNGLRDRVQM